VGLRCGSRQHWHWLLLESRAKMRPSPAHARTRTRARARAHAHTRTRHTRTRARAHAHTRTRAHAYTRTCARTRLRADHFTSPVTCKSAAIFHRTHMDKSRDDQRQHWQQQIVAGVQAVKKIPDFLMMSSSSSCPGVVEGFSQPQSRLSHVT